MLVSVSLLNCNFLKLEEELRRLENVDYIHIDLMDGHFVPNISMGIGIIEDIKNKTNKPLDVHLMFQYPLDFVGKIAPLLDEYDIITIHVESDSNVKETIYAIKEKGIKAGIALNPWTPIERIKPYINDVDLVLQMTVHPGYGSQDLIPEALDKIEEIRNMRSDVLIEVDGGINENNVSKGVDIVVVGSALWKSDDIGNMISKIKLKSV